MHEDELMSCQIKDATGIECLGCGAQRSAIQLSEGKLKYSFDLYPGLIPMVMLGILLPVYFLFFRKKSADWILSLAIQVLFIIVGSYILRHFPY